MATVSATDPEGSYYAAGQNRKVPFTITLAEYLRIHRDFRGVWSSGGELQGRRTLVAGHPHGGSVLLIEGHGFTIL